MGRFSGGYTRGPLIPLYESGMHKKSHTKFILASVIIVSLLIGAIFFATRNAPPRDFPTHSTFTVEEGVSGRDVLKHLKNENYIASWLYAEFLLKRAFTGSYIHAGTYSVTDPLTTREILRMLTDGALPVPPIVVTFPEGFQISNIDMYLPDSLKVRSYDTLVHEEGYLFPDTYYINSSDTLDELVNRMKQTFEEKTQKLFSQPSSSTLTKQEAIILASILEREANDEKSMRMVSGIIHNRLAIGMPLQVDATLNYILKKTSAELTLDDLKIDSPFNTYLYKGLPPAPIANPGLTALEAALNPQETDYLYYLTGSDGSFYYARTHDEHTENKAIYLRQLE